MGELVYRFEKSSSDSEYAGLPNIIFANDGAGHTTIPLRTVVQNNSLNIISPDGIFNLKLDIKSPTTWEFYPFPIIAGHHYVDKSGFAGVNGKFAIPGTLDDGTQQMSVVYSWQPGDEAPRVLARTPLIGSVSAPDSIGLWQWGEGNDVIHRLASNGKQLVALVWVSTDQVYRLYEVPQE